MSRKGISASINLVFILILLLFAFTNCAGPEGAVDQTSNSGNNNGGGPGPTPTPTPPGNAGQQYFQNTLSPMLNNRCNSCHALPKDVPPGNPIATLNIYNYTFMRNLIAQGPTSVNNPLFNETRGANHGGGDQCFGDINGSVSPCREIKAWTVLEFPLYADGVAGAIVNVGPTGDIRGWAIDPRNRNAQLQVFIYSGAAGAGGTLLAQVVANQAGDGQYNGHFFDYQMPPNLANGVPRNLYVYAIQAVAANLLPSMPYTAVAYTPRQAGQTHFNNVVRPQLQVCVQCHGNLDYMTRYYSLVSPLPYRGGTATNNQLINKMNGESHSGGSHCGGNKNSGRCATVRDWWILEFQ